MSAAIPQRVLVVGSGSIAQRHTRNLLALGVTEVVVLTRRDLSGVEAFEDARVTSSADIPDDCPAVAIVANDTDKHVPLARQLVALGASVLVEKPIADGITDELLALREEARAAGVVVRVAYNLRFLGAIGRVGELLADGVIGRRLFARIEVGQWLPDWRPGRPVTELYSASQQRGGGVALDLSHEVDYLTMLFGTPEDWRVLPSSTGLLGIEAPDVFEGIYAYPDGFSATVHMDYLERVTRRRIRVVGAEGVIECDVAGKLLRVARHGEAETRYEQPGLFDGPGTYLAELESFFAEVSGETPRQALPSLEDSIEVLRLLDDPCGARPEGGDHVRNR